MITDNTATDLYVIDYDATGNYRVRFVESLDGMGGYAAPIWRFKPFRLHPRRQQVQGRFHTPADAVWRAKELADQYSQVKG
jgi:hypothetical protein